MDNSVTKHRSALAQFELDSALKAARRYSKKSRADSTWRAYKSDWRQFEAWCQAVSLPSLPSDPDYVAMFIASQASDGLNPSTLNRRLAAIRLVHLGAGYPSPHNALKVVEVMRGIRRDWAQPPDKKVAALDEDIKKMADVVDPESAMGLRDRALLLFGFAGAFRRSELVALNTWNLEEREEGLRVTINKSKTDQEAQGQVIAIVRQPDSPYCPVQSLNDWLTVSEIDRGAVFRRMFRGDNIGDTRLSAQSVALVVKEYASRAGLDWERYAGHSLRSGFLTSAARARASVFKMADQSRHKSLETMRRYVQETEILEDNAGAGLLADE